MNLQEYFTSKNAESERRNQGEAATFVPPTDHFKMVVTNIDYVVKEELQCQSDFSEVLEDTRTFQTPVINLSDPPLWPKICQNL
jgi:hypothetical protein